VVAEPGIDASFEPSLVEVSLLPEGAFSGFIARRQAEGADLGHLKPPHINPSDRVLALLLSKEIMPVAAKDNIPVAR